jgi:adenylate cyclase
VSRHNRRLAAILAADVAGYSRLMSIDEEGTLERFNALRSELIDPKIAQFKGAVRRTAGDSLLVEFSSAVDAVQCAVEGQDGIASRNADLPDDHRIIFRMGLNVGDVIADGGTIYGDAVNVAARLEKMGPCR